MRDVYFEKATVAFVVGEIGAGAEDALCIGANAQGIMASGHAGRVRLAAGPEVERELRAQVPLLLGEAYLTGAGKLADLGVQLIVHVVANEAPGAQVQRAALERGLERALELLDQQGISSLAMPDLGLRIQNIDVEAAAGMLVDALTRRLRRGAALERVRIVSLDPAYLRAARNRFIELGAGEA